jgi:hypothetical protein
MTGLAIMAWLFFFLCFSGLDFDHGLFFSPMAKVSTGDLILFDFLSTILWGVIEAG